MSKSSGGVLVRFANDKQQTDFEGLAQHYGLTASQAFRSVATKALNERQLHLDQAPLDSESISDELADSLNRTYNRMHSDNFRPIDNEKAAQLFAEYRKTGKVSLDKLVKKEQTVNA